MNNRWIISLLMCLLVNTCWCASDVIGFWNTTDADTGKPDSIVAVYEYKGHYYGRIIATFDKDGKMDENLNAPVTRAPGLKDSPYYAGLDFLWDLKPEKDAYKDGKIFDPKEGKEYGAEMWREGPNLIVRGEIAFFGQNQTWPPAADSQFTSNFPKPDVKTFVPKKPELKS